jgi:hypothetical protein
LIEARTVTHNLESGSGPPIDHHSPILFHLDQRREDFCVIFCHKKKAYLHNPYKLAERKFFTVKTETYVEKIIVMQL